MAELGPETLGRLANEVAETWSDDDELVVEMRLCAAAWEADLERPWHSMDEAPSGSGWKLVTLEETSMKRRVISPIRVFFYTDGRREWDHNEDDDFRMVAWQDLPPALALASKGGG